MDRLGLGAETPPREQPAADLLLDSRLRRRRPARRDEGLGWHPRRRHRQLHSTRRRGAARMGLVAAVLLGAAAGLQLRRVSRRDRHRHGADRARAQRHRPARRGAACSTPCSPLIGHSGAYANESGLHPPRGIHGRGAGAFRCQDGKYVQFDSSSARHLVWFAQAAGITDWGPELLDIVRLRDESGQPALPRAAARAVPDPHRRANGRSSAIGPAPRSAGPARPTSGSPPSTRARSAPWCSWTTRSSARPGWPACRCI